MQGQQREHGGLQWVRFPISCAGFWLHMVHSKPITNLFQISEVSPSSKLKGHLHQPYTYLFC